MSSVDPQKLIKEAFGHLNAFKRARTLANQARMSGAHEQAKEYELQCYQRFDALELSLRAVQRGLYNDTSEEDHD